MRERWTGALLGVLTIVLTYGLVSLTVYGWFAAAAVCALVGWSVGERVRRLRRMAEHDELTGVSNRRPFERILSREWQRAVRYGEPLGLLFLDVDDFGQVNKVYGHLAGDAILRYISNQIRQAVRVNDVVARWGGEEFVVLLPHTTVAEAAVTAERIRAVVAQSAIRDHDRTISVTISTGVAGVPGTAKSPNELLRQAIQGQTDAKMRKNAVAVSC